MWSGHINKGLGAGALVLMLAFSACQKSDKTGPGDDNQAPTIQDVLSVQNGTYHAGSMPQPAGDPQAQPQITGVSGNSVVIPGGSVTLTVDAQDPQGDMATLNIGVEGLDGYYSVDVSQSKAFVITLLISQGLNRDTLKLLLNGADAAGNIGAILDFLMTRTQVGTGQLQVSLSWDQLNDVDLHLVEPTGEEIYYGSPTSSAGGWLDLDSNAGCSIDSVNNENITYPDSVTLPAGQYIVRVDFWSDCNVTDTTRYTVSARLNGNLITPDSGSNPYTGFFAPGTSDGGGAGSGVTVMKFTVSGTTMGYVLHYPRAAQTRTVVKKTLRK